MKINTSIPAYFGVLLCAFLIQFPFISFSQNIQFGKSYINVTKGVNGGTVEPGDVLEIRASIVVRSGTYDSCGYFDVIPTGTTYIPGTIRVLTNEGKVYKQFTDAVTKSPWVKPTQPYPHVARGGGWDDDPDKLRSAARRASDRSWKMQDPQLPKSIWYLTDAQWLGIRVVRPLKVPSPDEMQKFWHSGTERD